MKQEAKENRAQWGRVGTAWPLLALYLLNAGPPPDTSEWRTVCDARKITDSEVAAALGVPEKTAARWRRRLADAKVIYPAGVADGWLIWVREHTPTQTLLDRAIAEGISVGRAFQAEQSQTQDKSAEAQNDGLLAAVPASPFLM